MTILYEVIRVVHILRPKWLEMLIPNFQPRFALSIVVYHGGFLYTVDIGFFLIAQA